MLLGLVVMVAYVEVRDSPRSPAAVQETAGRVVRAENSPSRRRLDALEQRVAALTAANERLQLATVAQVREQPVHQLPSDIEGEGVEETAPPLDRERRREVQKQKRRKLLSDLNDRVENEAADPEWRVRRERTIDGVFSQVLGAQTSIGEVVCASSTCRVRLDHPSMERLPSDALQSLTMNREGLEDMSIHYQYDEGRTTLFLVERNTD